MPLRWQRVKPSWRKSCWDSRAKCKQGLGVDIAETDVVAGVVAA